MRLNENIAVSTSKVLLVPYDAHHVPRYHQWMEDAAIREATASERLTLDEEYENQASWREANDKLTFIVCEPLPSDDHSHYNGQQRSAQGHETSVVVAGEADAPPRMMGDINLFLTPWEPDDDTDARVNGDPRETCCSAEVDIMIADQKHRGKGFGRAAVATFLLFVRRNLDGILAEYAGAGSGRPALRELIAKINAGNAGSIALFKSLGFEQRGGVNYFGEIQMVLEGFGLEGDGMKGGWVAAVGEGGYRELGYDRSRLK
ncbi:GNAT domain-containing protein [Jackrogersella minutella]|nr:GNAT domain-containing protein [Jackrogersella minutella]